MSLRCAVQAGNMPARRLCRSLGFRSYGVEPDATCVDRRFFDKELLTLDLRAG